MGMEVNGLMNESLLSLIVLFQFIASLCFISINLMESGRKN